MKTVRERVYLAISADEAKQHLLRESRRSGWLAGTRLWLDYRVAPTIDGCVVELVDSRNLAVVGILLTWLLALLAASVALLLVLAATQGRTLDITFAVGLFAVLVVFLGMTRVQPRLLATMASQAVRESFGDVRIRPMSETTSASEPIRPA
jgi:hypothetical protein